MRFAKLLFVRLSVKDLSFFLFSYPFRLLWRYLPPDGSLPGSVPAVSDI